jgi:hypothetical protein
MAVLRTVLLPGVTFRRPAYRIYGLHQIHRRKNKLLSERFLLASPQARELTQLLLYIQCNRTQQLYGEDTS